MTAGIRPYGRIARSLSEQISAEAKPDAAAVAIHYFEFFVDAEEGPVTTLPTR